MVVVVVVSKTKVNLGVGNFLDKKVIFDVIIGKFSPVHVATQAKIYKITGSVFPYFTSSLAECV